MPLPGNRDVGDEPPGQDPSQIVDASRLARWDRFFGIDCWSFDAEACASSVLTPSSSGSGLARETNRTFGSTSS
jgi:hypothetical protein